MKTPPELASINRHCSELERIDAEIGHCVAAQGDPQYDRNEQIGAAMGELDWRTEKELVTVMARSARQVRRRPTKTRGVLNAMGEDMCRRRPPAMKNPLEGLPFPVICIYPQCGALLANAVEVDEHITEEHLPESIWTFAENNMRAIRDDKADIADSLSSAWAKYVKLFGEQPHGTKKQFLALLELSDVKNAAVIRTGPEEKR